MNERKHLVVGCAVIGDEPVAPWLLNRLGELSVQRSDLLPLVWLGLGRTVRSYCVPVGFLERFALPIAQTWSAECLTPRKLFSWDPKNLNTYFSDLAQFETESELFAALLEPTPRIKKACRAAIELNPDLLLFAKAIWRRVGRTFRLSPEQFVLGSIMCRRMAWWEPHENAFAGKKLTIDPRLNTIESIVRRRDGALTINFSAALSITAAHWVITCNATELALLCSHDPALLAVLFPSTRTYAAAGDRCQSALYPLKVKLKSDVVPLPMQPLTLYVDTEVSPIAESEVWPIEQRHGPTSEQDSELTIWASAFAGVSLEDVLDRLGQGFDRLTKLLPYASAGLRTLGMPLYAGQCFDQTQRDALLRELEMSQLEMYDTARLTPHTRFNNVHALLPNLSCHLPYPIGPFLAAEQVVSSITRPPKVNRTTSVQQQSAPLSG